MQKNCRGVVDPVTWGVIGLIALGGVLYAKVFEPGRNKKVADQIAIATAKANKLLLSSYSVPGSDLYTRIQVASSLATSFAGVKGYLPQNVTYNTVAENFDKGVSLLVGPAATK